MDAKKYDVSKYERPSVTADIVVFTVRNKQLQVLLIKRKEWPFEGNYALPGGFVRIDETIDQAAIRELREETGVSNIYLEQLYTFGDLGRDPRTRVITVAHMALIDSKEVELKSSTDSVAAEWHDMKNLPKLAFDHEKILQYALKRLRTKLTYSNIAFTLLPDEFTLTQVQHIYEIILDRPLDKRNFRKKLAALDLVKPTQRMMQGAAHRPAKLYGRTNRDFRIQFFN